MNPAEIIERAVEDGVLIAVLPSGKISAKGSRAEALDWGPLELFGCDSVKPYARIDRLGLVWLLQGRKLLAPSANTAAIATASGGGLTFPRISNEPGRVLAWPDRRSSIHRGDL